MFKISLEAAEHEVRMLPITTRLSTEVLPGTDISALVEHIWRMTNIRMFALHQPLPYQLMIAQNKWKPEEISNRGMWKSSTDFVFFAAEQDFTDSGKVHELFSELDPNVCIMLHWWSDNDFTHVCFCLAAQWTDTCKILKK